MKKIYLVLLLIISSSLYQICAQAVGDYGTSGSGNWSSTGTWVVCQTAGQWTDATAATATPNASNNIFIRAGHTVTLDASGKNCKNMVIENGATFKGNATQPTSSNVYLRLSGNLTNNGSFGASLVDNVCLECSTNVALQGTGSYKICRIRPAANISNITITFDADATITYIGSSGTGGAGLMTLNTGNDNITYIINAGKTLTFLDNCYFATSSSTSNSAVINSTFVINGSVVHQGVSGSLNLKTAPGKTCNFTVGSTGSYTLSKNLYVAQATDTTVNFVVNGTFTCGTGNFDLSNPKQIITGTGTFKVPAGGNITIAATDGLNASTGQIRTATQTYDAGAYITYTGTAAQVTGALLPATVGRLIINNAAGVTLSNSVKVADTLFLTSGLLKLGINTLTIGSAGGINVASPSAAKMISIDNLTCQVKKEYAADGSFTFPIGDLAGSGEYSPVTLDVKAASYASAFISVRMANVKQPNNTSKSDFLARYWSLSSSGLTSPNYSADFYYLPTDVNGKIANITGLKYAGNTWSITGSVDTTNSKISVTGQTTFGDFTGGEAGSIPVELVSFTASANGKNVVLQWKTATETNNKGFVVERNINGKYESIAFVNGAGTSTEVHNYSYTDQLVNVAAKNISYRLKQTDFDGKTNYSNEAAVEMSLPVSFNMSQNYPNPFNPSTVISYQVPKTELITLCVYNSLGQEVAQLVNEVKSAGSYTVTFDAGKFSSGIYYAVFKSGRQGELIKTIKMSLIK